MAKYETIWTQKVIRANYDEIGRYFGISPLTARLLANRNLRSVEDMTSYLHGTLAALPDPYLMEDMDKGTDILAEKIREGKKIRIISDYDADGVTSNYILYKGLLRCGARVDYRIPDRIEDGYGMNIRMIEEAKHAGIDTIITCDNGISAIDQIEEGNRLGMTIVVTDHHEPDFEEIEEAGEVKKNYLLPRAAAVIDPVREDCHYPESKICGAVVAWNFIMVLYEKMGIPREEALDFTEMAALGTHCDVMPLRGINRIIVKEGLVRMENTANTGLRALIRCCDIKPPFTAFHLGFVIGPCINAAGRLDTAKMALELLLCEDEKRCMTIAGELSKLNQERQKLTRQEIAKAEEYIEENDLEKDRVLVIYLKDCHESIAGIVAGKIRERYNKPTYVVARAKDCLKGSGRSIDEYNMFEEMKKVSDLLLGFGGHTGAAGFSLTEDNFNVFRKKLNEVCTLNDQDLAKKVLIDMEVPVSRFSAQLIREFGVLEPCGRENRSPLFGQRRFHIRKMDVRGIKRNVISLMLEDPEGGRITGVIFNRTDEFLEDLIDSYGENIVGKLENGEDNPVILKAAFTPRINEWMGREYVELTIKEYCFQTENVIP